MPKRKLMQEASADLSDLSPPPTGLLDGVPPVEPDGKPNGIGKAPSRKKQKTKEVKQETVKTETELNRAPSTKSARAARKKEIKYEEEPESDEEPKPATSKGKKRKVKVEEEVKVENGEEDEGGDKKIKRKRKTKEEKEAEAMPLAARTVGHKLFIGAHVSSAGGRICPASRVCRSRMLSVVQVSTIASPTASTSAPTPSRSSSNLNENGRTRLSPKMSARPFTPTANRTHMTRRSMSSLTDHTWSISHIRTKLEQSKPTTPSSTTSSVARG